MFTYYTHLFYLPSNNYYLSIPIYLPTLYCLITQWNVARNWKNHKFICVNLLMICAFEFKTHLDIYKIYIDIIE
jgi:hypothetical protein